MIIIFEKCAIGHILFKFMLYNNYNCENRERSGFMNRKSAARFCGFFAVCATVVATVLEVLSVLFFYDKTTNYFLPDAILPSLAAVWALLAFAAAVIFAVAVPREEIASKSPFGTRFAFALPAAIGFGVGAIFAVVDFAQSREIWFLIATLFLLLSAAHVLLSETERAIPLLGFAPPIACAFMVGILYFDASLEMNAPLKVAAQTALLPLMLYFTAELRYLLNREIPRLYSALALISVALASLCVLAVPVAFVAGILKNTACLAASLVVLGSNITILLRLKRFLAPIPSPDENDTKETNAQ